MHIFLPQVNECFPHALQGVRGRQIPQQLLVVIVFPLRQRFFFSLRICFMRPFQNDFQTFPAGHAPQAVINRPVKINAFFIGNFFPCLIMVFVRRYQHTIQIKNYILVSHIAPQHFVCHIPQKGSTGLLPTNSLLPVSLSTMALSIAGAAV